MNIAVIIPTYNESESIVDLLHEVTRIVASSAHTWSVVIVDGNSPDGTAALVQDFAHTHPSVHVVIESEKRGLALAYITGMRYAIEELGADAFVEFDGDGQHDPMYLPLMAQALDEGADYVIGSRYVAGGSVPREWRLYNRMLSRFGSLYARLLLEVPVHDVTSGFKMTRVAGYADKLSLREEALLTKYYPYKIQLLWEMWRNNATIKEIPIAFKHRERGNSKSTMMDIIESLRVTFILRLKSLPEWRLLRVVLIGASGVGIQALIFELLGIQLQVVSPGNATLIGAELVILSNFFLNERFAFRDRVSSADPFWQRILRFHLISSGSVFCQWAIVSSIAFLSPSPLLLRLGFFFAIGLGFAVNYIGYYFWVWKQEATKR